MEDCLVRVLLVDDDEDDYIITRDLLAEIEGRQFCVEWAATYEGALEAMERGRHDVCLIDYRLGERNGLELLRQALGTGYQTPMILLTGQGDHAIDLEAMQAGAADYLVKDQLDASVLERSIRYAIQRARTLAALRESEAANRALLAETQRRLKEQTALLEASAAISSTLGLPDVLRRVAEQMARAIDATSGYICSLDRQAGASAVLAEYLSPHASERERVSDLGFTYEETDARLLEPMLEGRFWVDQVDDPELLEHDRRYMEQFGAQSILYIPLYVRGQTVGYAELWESRRRREFTAEEIALCRAIGQNAAVALENARLYDQAKQEIAERVRAQQEIQATLSEKVMLLQEIHHRVKNNLQVVDSMLNLQSRQIRDPHALAVLRESQVRIRSMALIHEKLYRSDNLARIDLAEYIRDLATHLLHSYRTDAQTVGLSIQAEAAYLGIDTAVPCGLILSELISNALKHAFPPNWDGRDGQGGVICIQLRKDGSRRMTLVVADNGIGLPPDFDSASIHSLGFQLVCVLVNQLDGTLEIVNNGGAEFRITFTAA